MIKYALYQYSFDQIKCFEHEDKQQVITEALERSSKDNGRFTYRMQMEIDGEFVGGMRFFQDGREFTNDIVDACMEGILGDRYIESKK